MSDKTPLKPVKTAKKINDTSAIRAKNDSVNSKFGVKDAGASTGENINFTTKKAARKNNQLPVAFAYFLTLLIGLCAFGSIGYYICQRFVFNEVETSSLAVDTGVPDSSDRYTTLYVQVSESGVMANGLLVRVIPDKSAIRIVPVSPGLLCEGETMADIFTGSGVIAVRSAVEEVYGVDIDKYMTVSDSSFDSVVDYIGGVTYTPTEDLFYYNPETGEELSCKRGEKIALNHHLLRLLINYPTFDDGPATNSKVMADVMEKFINDAFMQVDMLQNNMDTLFSVIYNSSDTDMSRNDFIRYKSGLTYILQNETSPCDSLNPTGVWTDNTFEVSQGFVTELENFFDPQ